MLLKPNYGAVGVILIKQGASKNASKKGAPTRRKWHLIPLPGGSRTGSHYQELFEHKQLLGHKLKQLFEFLPENVDWAQN